MKALPDVFVIYVRTICVQCPYQQLTSFELVSKCLSNFRPTRSNFRQTVIKLLSNARTRAWSVCTFIKLASPSSKPGDCPTSKSGRWSIFKKQEIALLQNQDTGPSSKTRHAPLFETKTSVLFQSHGIRPSQNQNAIFLETKDTSPSSK